MAAKQVLQGAGTGAAAGSAFGPLGAAAGGALGGVLGAFGEDPEAARKAAMDAYNIEMANAGKTFTQGAQGVASDYDRLGSIDQTVTAQQDYQGKLGALDPTKYNVTTPTFDTTNTLDVTQKFLDPSMDLAIKQAGDQIQASAAGKSGLYSGATGVELANSASDTASKYWGDAFDRAQGELNRQNQIKSTQFGADMTGGKYNLGLEEEDIDLSKRSYDDYGENLDTANQIDIDTLTTMFGADQAAAVAKLQAAMGSSGKSNPFGDVLNALDTGSKIYSRVKGK